MWTLKSRDICGLYKGQNGDKHKHPKEIATVNSGKCVVARVLPCEFRFGT